MESLIYDMRYSVLTIARGDKQKAKKSLQSFLQRAYATLQGDELEEFLRDIVVLEQDIEHVSS